MFYFYLHAADCGNPTPENGLATYSSGTTLGQTATVSCNAGYDINGSTMVVCEHSGWNDTTTCDIQSK